ncbi:unnamed protein product, partial [Meganyctiphanes norvegica]
YIPGSMSPTQNDNEKDSEVSRSGEEDPLTQMLNGLSLTDVKTKSSDKEPTIDLIEGLRHLDIKKEDAEELGNLYSKKEDDETEKEESESEEETNEKIKSEDDNQHEEDKLHLYEEENEGKTKKPKEIDESLSEKSSKEKNTQSDDDKTDKDSDDDNTTEESDDENPADELYEQNKSYVTEDNYEHENSYKPVFDSSPEETPLAKSKVDEEKTKKPKAIVYAKRGLGTGAGGGIEYHNAFPDFMYQDQLRATTPYSAIQPNSSPAYGWSPDSAQNSSPTHAWSPDNSFSMDTFDSSAYHSPPYMSGSDCGNLGSNGQMYMNQNSYQDQYSYPLTPPFSDGASIQDESDFSDGVPSPMAPSQHDFMQDYTQIQDEHSLDDILEVLNKEKFGGLDVTGCVPPEKIMPYLQELLRIPEGSENADNSGNNQDVSPTQPILKPRETWSDGRNQTSAEHEIRKRLNPEVLEKTTRQINYQENEKLCEKDEEGDTPYMVVVSNYERKNYYELLYAMQERLKTIRICCDLPVCVRTHACKVCGNTDDLQFYSPLSMRNNVGDTALKNAVSMKFPKEVVNYLCSGLEERQGDMRRVFDMEASNFFQQNSFIYPVLARFL